MAPPLNVLLLSSITALAAGDGLRGRKLSQSPSPACLDKVPQYGGYWHSAYGDKCTCEWFEKKAYKRCREYGDYTKYGQLSANEACCVCGGGFAAPAPAPGAQCFDTSFGATDYGHYTCGDYSRYPKYCAYGHYYDDSDFSHGIMCCACGGGTTDPGACADKVPESANHWHEEYTCEWFGEETKRCNEYGHYTYNGSPSASEACCVCGGGVAAPTPAPPARCFETSFGAVDSYGDTCGDYARYPEWCTDPLADLEWDGSDFSHDMCCACGGGTTDPGACANRDKEDGSDWHSAYGRKYTCEWFGENTKRCNKYGEYTKHGQLSANEACCVCGGGMAGPTPAPTAQCFDTSFGADGFTYYHYYYEPDTCVDYVLNPDWCTDEYGHYYDDLDFSHDIMCCACGGGTTDPGVCADRLMEDGSHWRSVYGQKYTCEWFAEDRLERCDRYGFHGSDIANVLTANEACCVCGGGTSTAPTPSPQPTAQCFETSFGAADSFGDACGDYLRRPHWCTDPLADLEWDDSDFSHEIMCCACGGGATDAGVCADRAMQDGRLWHAPNREAYPCAWFAESPAFRCSELGNLKRHGELSANEACCVCGGGEDPSATTTYTLASTTQTSTLTPETACLRVFLAVDHALYATDGACVPVDDTCPGQCRELLEDMNAKCEGEFLEPLGATFSGGFFALVLSAIFERSHHTPDFRRLSDALRHFSEGQNRRLSRPTVPGMPGGVPGMPGMPPAGPPAGPPVGPPIGFPYYEEFETPCADVPLLALLDNPWHTPTCQDGLVLWAFLGQPICGAPGQCSELCGRVVDSVFERCDATDTTGEGLGGRVEDSGIIPAISAEELVLLAPAVFSEDCLPLVENRTLAAPRLV